MEKISLQKQKLNPNFIGSWLMEPLSISDELIDYFEANENKQKRGVTAAGANLGAKDSTDIKITPKEIKLPGNKVFEKYFHALLRCYQDYVLEWPFLESFPETIIATSRPKGGIPCLSRALASNAKNLSRSPEIKA